MTPPDASKPIMIWQWMDGLISREGIRADLEAYKEAGIGGVQNFQVGGTTQGLAKDTTNAIGSVRWQQLMRFAIDECSRLGLSFGTHNCPGWSSSAYPTVEPQYAMQKLVWTSINVASLDKPWPMPEQPEAYDGYYEDIATIAVPKEGGGGTIYRFGHTANGKTNSGTAPESGVGLECDKMSREAVEHYWAGYPTLLLNIAGEETGKTFQRLEIDSYEAGGQEWTKLMPQEFMARKGYDILPWLPALAGEVIESKEATERFMRDWRETVTDLFCRKLLRLHEPTGSPPRPSTARSTLRDRLCQAVQPNQHRQDSATTGGRRPGKRRVLGCSHQLGMERHRACGQCSTAGRTRNDICRGVHLLAPTCLARRPGPPESTGRLGLLPWSQQADAARCCSQSVGRTTTRHDIRHVGHMVDTGTDMVEGWSPAALHLFRPMPGTAATRTIRR